MNFWTLEKHVKDYLKFNCYCFYYIEPTYNMSKYIPFLNKAFELGYFTFYIVIISY
jgi:hypothetical protein